jgi:glycosyltransferase involved in cell wall biosynthesis
MQNKPKTLVILTPGFPSDEGDTACLPAQQVFVRALNRNYPKLRVVLISFEYPPRRERYSWFGNTVIAVNGWKKGRMNKAWTLVAVWRMLVVLQREHEVVGLLSFWCGGCALVGKYYGQWKKLPHFIWILGQDARKGNWFVSLIRPKAKELVAMSDFLADEFYRNYAIRPLHIIPNGVDPSLYAQAGTGSRDIDLLGAGSLIPLKQYDLFLLAVRDLRDRLPGIKVTLCGKGPEEERLKALIRDFRLQDNVTLTGELPHTDILRLMQRSRVFLHTSSYEGFSTVCLEALYAGAQVISFCKPMDAFIPHWYVAKTTEDLIGKMLEILTDEEIDYTPVLAYAMSDCAQAMMRLYSDA